MFITVSKTPLYKPKVNLTRSQICIIPEVDGNYAYDSRYDTSGFDLIHSRHIVPWVITEDYNDCSFVHKLVQFKDRNRSPNKFKLISTVVKDNNSNKRNTILFKPAISDVYTTEIDHVNNLLFNRVYDLLCDPDLIRSVKYRDRIDYEVMDTEKHREKLDFIDTIIRDNRSTDRDDRRRGLINIRDVFNEYNLIADLYKALLEYDSNNTDQSYDQSIRPYLNVDEFLNKFYKKISESYVDKDPRSLLHKFLKENEYITREDLDTLVKMFPRESRFISTEDKPASTNEEEIEITSKDLLYPDESISIEPLYQIFDDLSDCNITVVIGVHEDGTCEPIEMHARSNKGIDNDLAVNWREKYSDVAAKYIEDLIKKFEFKDTIDIAIVFKDIEAVKLEFICKNNVIRYLIWSSVSADMASSSMCEV